MKGEGSMSSVTWKQLTLGHLSRNKFWGESDNAQYHSVVATTTLVQAGGKNILVDPTLPVDETERLLQTHCGLTRNDIHIVYATHYHLDHRVDAERYPNAALSMAAASLADGAAEAERVKQGNGIPQFAAGVERFAPAPQQLAEGVRLCPLPGHTDGNTGLLLDAPEGKVLLCGDTVMGEEYFCAGEGYWFNTSAEKTRQSLEWAANNADILVPGHGDQFAVKGRTAFGTKPVGCSWCRLNLGTPEEEQVVLVRSGDDKILIDPCLPGPRLREVLYDRTGLDPADITHVLCLDSAPQHRLDVEILKHAKLRMPAAVLQQAWASSPDDVHLPLFLAYEKAPLPEITLAEENGQTIALFQVPEGVAAAAAQAPTEEFLEQHRVAVLLAGRNIRWVRTD